MIVPDKFTNLSDSILGSLNIVLDKLEEPTRVGDLINNLSNKVEDLDKLVLIIDTLYVLDLIDIDFETEIITCVSRN